MKISEKNQLSTIISIEDEAKKIEKLVNIKSTPSEKDDWKKHCFIEVEVHYKSEVHKTIYNKKREERKRRKEKKAEPLTNNQPTRSESEKRCYFIKIKGKTKACKIDYKRKKEKAEVLKGIRFIGLWTPSHYQGFLQIDDLFFELLSPYQVIAKHPISPSIIFFLTPTVFFSEPLTRLQHPW